MEGVSLTAVWVAAMRASEVTRPDRLHDDPLAAAFVAAAHTGVADIPPGASEFLAIRTRFNDDYLVASGARQVVALAAGLDSRAFRLDWPAGTRLFELDLPALLEFKESVIAGERVESRCERVVVPADLRTDWATPLTAAGFDPEQPTAWLAEGLLPYLSADECDRLLSTIGRLSLSGSTFAFDQLDRSGDDTSGVRTTTEAVRSMGASLISTVDDPVDWLARHGWQATTARVPALGVHYGRPLPDFVDMAASNATMLCSATLSHS